MLSHTFSRSISRSIERPSVFWPFMAVFALICLLSGAARAVRVKAVIDKPSEMLSMELDRQNRYMRTGKWFPLLEEYRSLVSIGNVPPDLHFLLGRLYYSLGQYNTAVIELEECIEYAPEHKMALYCLGKCYSQLGNTTALEHLLNGALKPWSNEKPYYFLQGKLKIALKEYAGAVSFFEKSRGSSSNLPVLTEEALAQYLAGDMEKSEITLHKILVSEPRIGAAHELLALIYIRQGRLNDALQQLNKVKTGGPSAQRARRGRNILYRVMEGTLSEYALVSYFQAGDLSGSSLGKRLSCLRKSAVRNLIFLKLSLSLR